MLWEQAAMIRNSAGAGSRKQPNPGHFGPLINPGRMHFCRSKKRTRPGKEDIWSPISYTQLYVSMKISAQQSLRVHCVLSHSCTLSILLVNTQTLDQMVFSFHIF